MALHEDLKQQVARIFCDRWETRNGTAVPEPVDLGLGNEAVLLDATVLYADLDGSTAMVDQQKAHLSAEVYKSYLHCCAKVIQTEGGVITAYDGDRVMAVFIGDYKNTSAAKCALKINYAVHNIINPGLKAQYPDSTFTVKQVVGIDTSPLFVTRTGVRGDNDLVWVGRAANYAAKLTELGNVGPTTWITEAAYNRLNDEAKFGGAQRQRMWMQYKWTQMKDHQIFGSTWWWRID